MKGFLIIYGFLTLLPLLIAQVTILFKIKKESSN
jgi:hypothetical protein